MSAYKCTYMEVNTDKSSMTFGYAIEQTKQFNSLPEAVRFSRMISNTCINIVGRPIIEEISE